jgi:hypothetical protein
MTPAGALGAKGFVGAVVATENMNQSPPAINPDNFSRMMQEIATQEAILHGLRLDAIHAYICPRRQWPHAHMGVTRFTAET